jgi:hypothetical protein
VIDIPNYAISALSKLFGHHISLVNDEVLVEHLECLAADKGKVRHD